ncbi:MAG: hypothetical protein ACR2N7_00800 [Acidimicrobiia bacterium]
MTTTSTGAHRFQTRNIIMLGVALATIAAIVFIQWTASQPQNETAAPNEAEAAESVPATEDLRQGYSLANAYSDGKFADGSASKSQPNNAVVPSTISVGGGFQEFADPSAAIEASAATQRDDVSHPGGLQEFADPSAPIRNVVSASATTGGGSISGGHQE